jgi:hypothetical protein
MVFIAKLLALALTATATPILRRDAVTVENDITQKIGPQTTTLTNDVNGFPASGLSGAVAICLIESVHLSQITVSMYTKTFSTRSFRLNSDLA